MILLRNGNTGAAGVQSVGPGAGKPAGWGKGGEGKEMERGAALLALSRILIEPLSGVFITLSSFMRRFKCFRLCLEDSPCAARIMHPRLQGEKFLRDSAS